MDNIAGQKSSLTWAVHISVAVLVMLWLLPTLGLFVSSFRSADQIAATGWWKSLFSQEQNVVIRTEKPDQQKLLDGVYVIEGNLFEQDGAAQGEVSVWGTSSKAIADYTVGETADLGKKGLLTVESNGDYRLESATELTGTRGQRVFLTATTPPSFSLTNYRHVLGKDSGTSSMAKAFINTLTVSIPSTIIPILIAAFAAYALAWMDFPGRALLIAFVVGLLVVPLQLALIPLLKLHLGIGIGKGYLGVWMAHTGFGLPLA
ncbi:MAG: alpha-glucoside transport system permease protein, partial [Celeribacter sp.]